MQFDSQERPRIFYIILFGLLIFAIVFFAHNVKKAINSSKAKQEAAATKSQSGYEMIVER
ncbi:MAG: hypothetical protein IJ867_05625 [Clostridia bacterium]|nr:hypothetical protein [Clostridia bacterium]